MVIPDRELSEGSQHATDADEQAGVAERPAEEAGGETAFADDRDSRTRRIFAQEFVTQLKRLGAGDARELVDRDGIAFFFTKPSPEEVEQVGRWAERYGWAKETDGSWAVTDAGALVPRPPSLGFGQVLTRIVRVANPVRTNAADWVPLLAVAAGAIAGSTTIHRFGAVDVVRALSLAVLVVSLAVQFYGEYCITWVYKRWRDSPPVPRSPSRILRGLHMDPTTMTFYAKPRLVVAAIFDVLVIAAFGLLIYWWSLPIGRFTLWFIPVKPWLSTVGLVSMALTTVAVVLELRWRRPRARYVSKNHLDTTIMPRR